MLTLSWIFKNDYNCRHFRQGSGVSLPEGLMYENRDGEDQLANDSYSGILK
jgi:hypothetical protein